MLTSTPNGLREIIAVFGSLDDPNFEANHIVSFPLPYQLTYDNQPVTHARCHRLLVDNFIQAFTEIQTAGLADSFTEYNGIYARRSIRGYASHPSTHSWGIAIDMCASQYPLGSAKRMPQAIVDIWRRAGFYYGGDFTHRPDGMHLQFATAY